MSATRQVSFSYQGVTVPGTISGCPATIHDIHTISKTSRDFEVSFTVLMHSASAGTLASGCATLEDAFRKPRGDLTVQMGGATFLQIRASQKEGLNIEGSVTKSGSDADSAGSRLYEVSISGDLPWTLASPGSGQQGLREFSYEVSFSASRRATLSVRGEYTAQASGSHGRAQYLAEIGNRVTTIMSLLGGTWPSVDKPESESYTPDDEDSIVTFDRTYREIIFGEQVGALDRPEVLQQTMTVTKDRTVSDDSGGEPWETIRVSYEASIDHTVTTDLRTFWETVARPWCMDRARSVTKSRTVVLESIAPTYDFPENVLRAELKLKAGGSIGQLISFRSETETEVDYGIIIARTWPKRGVDKTANPYFPTPAFITQGPRTTRQKIVTTMTFVPVFQGDGGRHPNLKDRGPSEGSTGLGAASGFAPLRTISRSGNFTVALLSKSVRVEQRKVGDITGEVGQLSKVTDRIITEVVELVGNPD